MSQKCEFQYNLLPFETIKEATQGDVDAVEEKCMMNMDRSIIV